MKKIIVALAIVLLCCSSGLAPAWAYHVDESWDSRLTTLASESPSNDLHNSNYHEQKGLNEYVRDKWQDWENQSRSKGGSTEIYQAYPEDKGNELSGN